MADAELVVGFSKNGLRSDMSITFDLYPTRNPNVIGDSTITIHVIGIRDPAGIRRDFAAPFVSEENLKKRMNTGLQGFLSCFLVSGTARNACGFRRMPAAVAPRA